MGKTPCPLVVTAAGGSWGSGDVRVNRRVPGLRNHPLIAASTGFMKPCFHTCNAFSKSRLDRLYSRWSLGSVSRRCTRLASKLQAAASSCNDGSWFVRASIDLRLLAKSSGERNGLPARWKIGEGLRPRRQGGSGSGCRLPLRRLPRHPLALRFRSSNSESQAAGYSATVMTVEASIERAWASTK